MPKIKVIPLLEIIFQRKSATSEVWKTVCELLQNKEQEISVFSSYIKHKINGYDKQSSLIALDLLDFCMDNGQLPLWLQISSKEFLSSFITNLKTRNDSEIQSKILFLIEKWAKNLSNFSPELSNFQNFYLLLKNNNVTFPINMESTYSKYVKYTNILKSNKNIYNSNNNTNNNSSGKRETDPESYLRDINLDLNTSSYEKKYKRLVNKLYDWTHDIHEINVLINKNAGGINDNKITGLIKELSKGNKQLVETIESGRLKDEKLMNISLNVQSDIDMTIRRWTNHKCGVYPNPFTSSFLQNNTGNHTQFNNNNLDIKDFYNIKNGTTFINNNNSEKKCGGNTSNNNDFNLLIDFNFDAKGNNNNNMSQNFDGKNNMKNFFDFGNSNNIPNQNPSQSQINNNINNFINRNINYNSMNNMININNNIYKSNNININQNFNENEGFDGFNNNNDPNGQSVMYPTFEEINGV